MFKPAKPAQLLYIIAGNHCIFTCRYPICSYIRSIPAYKPSKMSDFPCNTRTYRSVSRFRKVTDLCNSELNHLTTKYYRLLRFDQKSTSPGTQRREQSYRGKHSLSPLPSRSRLEERRSSKIRHRTAITPEPNSDFSLPIGNLEGVGVSRTPNHEKTTSTKDLINCHPICKGSTRKSSLLQAKSSRSGPRVFILALKNKEQTLPLLRTKRRIDVDMRVLQSRRERHKEGALPWSIDSSFELLTPK